MYVISSKSVTNISQLNGKKVSVDLPNGGTFVTAAIVFERLGMTVAYIENNMPFDARQVPGGDLWQIFVNDPNGVMIELNYEAAKEQGGSAPSERTDDIGAM